MSPQHNAQSTYAGSNTKRQRIDDPNDFENFGPPTKVSRTSSDLTRHQREASQEDEDKEASEKLGKVLNETLKSKNTIALCPPQTLSHAITSVLYWNARELSTCISVSIVVVDNVETIKRHRNDVRTVLPTLKMFEITGVENETELIAIDSGVIFTTPQALRQLFSCDASIAVRVSTIIIIIHDETFLNDDDDYDNACDNVLDAVFRLSSLGRPRVLVLFPTLRHDIPSGSYVLRFRDALEASIIILDSIKGDATTTFCQTGPTELVITYQRQEDIQETLLCQKLRECDAQGPPLSQSFRDASLVLRELGSCAADLVWREAFTSIEADTEALTTKDIENCSSLAAGANDLIKHWPFKLPNLDMTSRNVNVSHKFIRLVQVLERFQIYGDDFCGIVFVKKPIIARLLVALLHSLIPRLQFLRPVVLADIRISSDHKVMATISRQITSGQCNLLIATKSFEDTSLPEVPIVILFDIFESQVFRAYSRSHVRRKEGCLIHMTEEGNNAHYHALRRTTFDTAMLRWSDTVKYDSSCSFPPSSLQENGDQSLSDSENDQDDELIQDPLTGECLRKHQATTTLFRYAAYIGSENISLKGQPFLTYIKSENPGDTEWCCVIKLPGIFSNPLEGPFRPSRYLARREACYSACRQLQHLSQLNTSIFPQCRIKNDMAQTANTTQIRIDPGHEQPHVPLFPDFWRISISRPPFPGYLYPWIVSTASPGYGPDERAPICILTRAPLPDLPHVQLFHFHKSVQLKFHRRPPIQFDPNKLEQIHRFTVKFCRIFMNKPFYSAASQDLGYLFLPMRRKWNPSAEMDLRASPLGLADDVDWTTVSLASETWAVPLSGSAHLVEDLEDAVVQDRAVEFTHRCEVIRIRTDMTPLSEVDDKPLGYSLLKYAAFSADERFIQGGKTLLEQFHSRSKNFDGLKEPDQPILEVVRMVGASNFLNPRIPSNNEEPEKIMQLLIPEYTRKLTVPASTLRMGYLLPSILKRVDELLLVKQLNAKMLDFCVRDDLLMVATASPLTGNNYDYERLELLGDAFLKYLSSVYVFTQNPNGTEGDLHTARQRYISNQQLCHLASQLGLPGYIQVKPFSIKSWIPPGMKLAAPQKKEVTTIEAGEQARSTAVSLNSTGGKSNERSSAKTGKHSKGRKKNRSKKNTSSPIANKTVADVAEAIIGAAYITGGRNAALKASKALTIPFTDIEEWSDFDRRKHVTESNASRHLEDAAASAIEGIIGHKFQKRHLLALALTQTNFSALEMKHHQRLEFIGDAILDLLVVRYLYNKDERASPGDLSVSKSMMVSNCTLAAICVWSGLHRFIHTTQQLEQTIHNYEKALLVQRSAVSGAHQDSNRVVQHWKDLEAPKALSDVVESIIGATLISDAFSQLGVDAIFKTLLLPFYKTYVPPQVSLQPSGHNPKPDI